MLKRNSLKVHSKINKDRPVIIVISKSLVADQIRECGRFGLSSYKLEAENVESLKKECNFDIIFASPESFALNRF